LVRDLPLSSRVVLAAFLAAVGVGYLTALVQLHFQHAPPGQLLPGPAETERLYYGARQPPASRIEQLLEASSGPMNGAGTMRPAFTLQSRDWETATRGRTAEEVRAIEAQREGERLALLGWVRAGANREAYDRDDFPLGSDLQAQEITPAFLVADAQRGTPALPKRLRIRSLLGERCVSCHGEPGRPGEDALARLFPLDSYEHLRPHCAVPVVRNMPLAKLAQTTHAHLLSFAVLFGLTGLAFTFTSYPEAVRLIISPLPLVAQVLEIGCWWLGRYDPTFTQAIGVAGVVVALGLAVQILGTLWDLFGGSGRSVLVASLVLVIVLGGVVKVRVIDPYLERERSSAQAQPANSSPADR
jgi:hypothetical protein